MPRSELATKIANGSYYDNIVNFLRYGIDKAPLNEEDQQTLHRLERVRELWLQHKEDALVMKLICSEMAVSRAQAYNYLGDAKAIFALFNTFNAMAELLLLKERINRAYKMAEEDPKAYKGLYADAMAMDLKWIEAMQAEQQRLRPDEPKKFIFIYHNDYTQLPGMTHELKQQMEAEFDKMEKAVRHRKYKDAEEVEYVE